MDRGTEGGCEPVVVLVSGVGNKAVVQEVFEAFDAVDEEAMDRLLSADFVAHGLPSGFAGTAEGWKKLAAHWASGFSGDTFWFDCIIAEGDHVAVRYSSRGRHTGEVFGVPPSDRLVTITGIEFYRLADGRVVEYWGATDMSDLNGAAHVQ